MKGHVMLIIIVNLTSWVTAIQFPLLVLGLENSTARLGTENPANSQSNTEQPYLFSYTALLIILKENSQVGTTNFFFKLFFFYKLLISFRFSSLPSHLLSTPFLLSLA